MEDVHTTQTLRSVHKTTKAVTLGVKRCSPRSNNSIHTEATTATERGGARFGRLVIEDSFVFHLYINPFLLPHIFGCKLTGPATVFCVVVVSARCLLCAGWHCHTVCLLCHCRSLACVASLGLCFQNFINNQSSPSHVPSIVSFQEFC
eukprot:scaffold4247_cov174-Ochromonas_danica.AAC.15